MNVNDLPEQVEPKMPENDDFMQRFHHALLELHLEEGELICPETGRRFQVTKGISNMLLNEDEVNNKTVSLSYFQPLTFSVVKIILDPLQCMRKLVYFQHEFREALPTYRCRKSL